LQLCHSERRHDAGEGVRPVADGPWLTAANIQALINVDEVDTRLYVKALKMPSGCGEMIQLHVASGGIPAKLEFSFPLRSNRDDPEPGYA
jgi:hypothetical protein